MSINLKQDFPVVTLFTTLSPHVNVVINVIIPQWLSYQSRRPPRYYLDELSYLSLYRYQHYTYDDNDNIFEIKYYFIKKHDLNEYVESKESIINGANKFIFKLLNKVNESSYDN